jgi:hypothetical protein
MTTQQVLVWNVTNQAMVLAVRTSIFGVTETNVPPRSLTPLIASGGGTQHNPDQVIAAVAHLQRHGLVDGSGGPPSRWGSYLVQ